MALMEQTDTIPQHMVALANANRIRLERAEVKKKILAGLLTVEQALELPEMQGATISAVLRAQRRWGDTRTRKFLASIPILEGKLVGTMTARQKRSVVGELLTGAQRKELAAAAAAEARAAEVEGCPDVERVAWRTRSVSSTHLRLPALTFTLCGVEVPVDLETPVASGAPCLNCKRVHANL